MSGALLSVISAFVLAGLPTTSTLHVTARAAREGGALRREDRAVGREQVAALHALLARHRADEQRVVGIPEGDVGVVAAHDSGEQREGAIVQLHGDALERAQGGRDLEQLQDHRLVGTEQLPAGDAWEEAVADLAGSARDGDTNWGSACQEPSEERASGADVPRDHIWGIFRTRVRLDDGLRRDRDTASGIGPQVGGAVGGWRADVRACPRTQRARPRSARGRRRAGARERAARALGGALDRDRGARGDARAHGRRVRGHGRDLLPDGRRRRLCARARALGPRGARRARGRPHALPPAQRAGRRLQQLRPGRPRAGVLRRGARGGRPPPGRDAAVGAEHEHRLRLPRDPRPARSRDPAPRPRARDRGRRADRARVGAAGARACAEPPRRARARARLRARRRGDRGAARPARQRRARACSSPATPCARWTARTRRARRSSAPSRSRGARTRSTCSPTR